MRLKFLTLATGLAMLLSGALPLADITVTRDVTFVMKGGKVYVHKQD